MQQRRPAEANGRNGCGSRRPPTHWPMTATRLIRERERPSAIAVPTAGGNIGGSESSSGGGGGVKVMVIDRESMWHKESRNRETSTLRLKSQRQDLSPNELQRQKSGRSPASQPSRCVQPLLRPPPPPNNSQQSLSSLFDIKARDPRTQSSTLPQKAETPI